jgi:uncharacterized protein YjbI with pentapeptide repeats
MNADELKAILYAHKLWLESDGKKGERANLRRADLRVANLSGADLRRAYLRGADLSGANIDYSAWPLWCGSGCVKVDARIAAQLAAHFCALDCDSTAYLAARAAILDFAKTSHQAKDLGLLEDGDE